MMRMTDREPARLAVALLERLIGNEPLAGDLLEASRGRSHAWLWRQVVLAVLARLASLVRNEPRAAVETALLSAALLALLAFHAVVVATLVNHLLVLDDRAWVPVTGRYAAWQIHSLLPSFAIAVGLGRGIGRFHGSHRVWAALAFAASAALAAFLNLFLFVPDVLLWPFVPAAAQQTAVTMVFVAGLFAGISSRSSCERLFSSSDAPRSRASRPRSLLA
jgi:hypothetical protein